MLKKINITMLLSTIICFSLTVGILAGSVQNYIHFAGVENEMGFGILSTFGGVMFCLGIKK